MSDHWRETLGYSDQQVAEQITSDQIDILVDLAGHTTGNRLTALARKPAPIQISWLGYPNTTGLSAMDYCLTCDVQNPIDEPTLHSERPDPNSGRIVLLHAANGCSGRFAVARQDQRLRDFRLAPSSVQNVVDDTRSVGGRD